MSQKPDFNVIVEVNERVAEPLTLPFGKRALELARVSPGDRLLDVAAGTGGFAVAAAEAGVRVLATDIASAIVERAATRLQPFPSCEARAMACEELDLPDASFDAGFSLFGITLFSRWRDGLAELARVTRPGGCIALATWIAPEGAEPMVLLRKEMAAQFPHQEYWPGGHLNEWSEATLREAMASIGGEQIDIERHAVDFLATSLEAIEADLRPIYGFVPGYAALSDKDKDRLWQALRKTFARYALADGSIKISSPGLIAIARKALLH